MYPVKKVAKSVSYAGSPLDRKKTNIKVAYGFESMLNRHTEGKIVLSESFVEELKQKIVELRSL